MLIVSILNILFIKVIVTSTNANYKKTIKIKSV